MVRDVLRILLRRDRLGIRTTRNPMIVPAMLLAGIGIAVFIITTLLATKNLMAELDETMDRMTAAVETNQFPVDCEGLSETRCSRAFVYFYDAENSEIDVGDGSIEDWDAVHRTAVEEKHLKPVESPLDVRQSWVNSKFQDRTSSDYGIFITPIHANTIHFISPQVLHKPPSMSLRFARDDSGIVYVLGHVRDAGPGDYVLRLAVHYYDIRNEAFGVTPMRIKFMNNENSQVVSDLAVEFSHTYDSRLPVNLEGKGWRSGVGRFFELALWGEGHSGSYQLEAIELIAAVSLQQDRRYPVAAYLIGTGAPIPMNEEIGTYEMAKNLRHMTPHYELYHKEHRLTGRSVRSTDSDHVPTWWSNILNPLYRLYFSGMNVVPCLDELWKVDGRTTCYRRVGTTYRIRKGVGVSKTGLSTAAYPSKSYDVSVFTESDLAIPWDWGSTILFLSSVAPLGMLAYSAERARLRALMISEQDNQAKAGFLGTFTHQAGNEFRDVKRETRELADEENRVNRTERAERIEKMLNSVWERLERAAHIFDYEELVRTSIAENRLHEPFDVSNSVAELVDMFKEDRGVDVMEFCSNLRNRDPRPALGVTAAPDDDRRTPDGLFTEAMETILNNAVSYRQPSESPIMVTLNVERGIAVLRVLNYGPPLTEKMLGEVFKLGFRREGSGRRSILKPPFRFLMKFVRHGLHHDGAPEKITSGATDCGKDQGEHKGLGLFLVRQIIRGYGGSCQLENFQDRHGSGIIVTVWLPVRFV